MKLDNTGLLTIKPDPFTGLGGLVIGYPYDSGRGHSNGLVINTTQLIYPSGSSAALSIATFPTTHSAIQGKNLTIYTNATHNFMSMNLNLVTDYTSGSSFLTMPFLTGSYTDFCDTPPYDYIGLNNIISLRSFGNAFMNDDNISRYHTHLVLDSSIATNSNKNPLYLGSGGGTMFFKFSDRGGTMRDGMIISGVSTVAGSLFAQVNINGNLGIGITNPSINDLLTLRTSISTNDADINFINDLNSTNLIYPIHNS